MISLRRRQGRHAWKGAVTRNPYAVLCTPALGWVRVVYFGPDDWVVLDLDNRVLAPTPGCCPGGVCPLHPYGCPGFDYCGTVADVRY